MVGLKTNFLLFDCVHTCTSLMFWNQSKVFIRKPDLLAPQACLITCTNSLFPLGTGRLWQRGERAAWGFDPWARERTGGNVSAHVHWAPRVAAAAAVWVHHATPLGATESGWWCSTRKLQVSTLKTPNRNRGTATRRDTFIISETFCWEKSSFVAFDLIYCQSRME